EIEARSGLAEVRRREVGGEPLLREFEPRVQQCGPYAVPRFAHRSIGQAHDREDGQAAPDVHLHGDLAAVQSDKGACGDAGEHTGDATARSTTRGLRM